MTLAFVLKFLLVAAMAATLGALILGLFTMFKAGSKADERSNRMMRLRIIFQALAILFFSLLLFLKEK
ncbi:MAG: twin transmembrane helix small protein [Alphaproteobacteria bacterium]|nr:twin transmembrane helix small protein [Alphaproteobacteria bacterium]